MTIKELYEVAYKKNHLLSATLELNTICNFRCIHCYIPSHTNVGLSTKEVISIIKQLRENGVLNLTLTGGEIFLRNDFFEIIEFARRNHMRVFLLSNISLLTEDIIIRLKKLYITEISTTIFSMDPLINDSITKVRGSLAKILKSIYLLKKHKIPLFVKTPILESNSDTYLSVLKFAKNNEIRFMISPIIFSMSNGDSSNLDVRVDVTKLPKIMEKYNSLDGRSEPVFKSEEVPCSALFYNIFIDSCGNVFPCNTLYFKVGNVLNQSLKYIWNKSVELKFIKNIRNSDLKSCLTCDVKNSCFRCPGLAYLEENDIFACSSIAKENATAVLRNER